MIRHDVVIVGGGIVGATLACALAPAGFNVAVIDAHAFVPSPNPDEYDVRVSALTLASRRLLRNLEVWDVLEAVSPERLHPITRMTVWEQGQGIDFNANEIGADCLGLIVENRLLLTALYGRMNALALTRYAPATVSQLDLNEGSVRLNDGRVLHAALIVGADGRDSQIRQAIGTAPTARDYDQQAIVATVHLRTPHAGTAWQRFLPNGTIALLPLDTHRCSLVWSVERTQAEALLHMDAAPFAHALGDAIGQVSGEHAIAIDRVGKRAAFPLRAAQAEHYVASRVALIGDAAQYIHPLAGQGLNLGLMDAAALADIISDAHARHEDIGDFGVLRRYERWRKSHHLAMYAATDGLYRLFNLRAPALRWIRSTGMRVLNAATPLKKSMIRYAAGLHRDAPRLMRAALPFE